MPICFFRVLENFDSPEMKSGYVRNMVYTARTPELREIAEVWKAKGLIEPVEEGSLVGGTGEVRWP